MTSELLEERPDTTAVLAANDRLALGAIDAIREVGRSCPEDVSVVGFNDMPYSDRFSPPLTTVHISQNNLGSMAAKLLLETIADPGRPAETQLAAPGAGGQGLDGACPELTAQPSQPLMSEQPFVQSP